MISSVFKSKRFWIFAIIIFFIVIFASVLLNRPSGKQYMMDQAIESAVVSSRAAGSFAGEDSGVIKKEALPATPEAGKSIVNTQSPADDRMIIITADMNLEVTNVEETYNAIKQLTTRNKGYITQSNIIYSSENKQGTMSIRIPINKYQSSINSLSKLGKVLSNNESGNDVTEEYVDIQSRLKNLRVEEAALQRIMNKAAKIPDILNVAQQLTRVRGDIEQVTGRAKYLENQVALSTINITFNEPVPAVAKIVRWDIMRSVDAAFNALKVACRALITIIVWLIVFILPILIAAIIIYRLVKRIKK